MIILDYCLFVANSVILIATKSKANDIEERAKLFVAMMLYCVNMLLFALVFGAGVLLKILHFNRAVIIISAILLFVISIAFVFRRYSGLNYDIAIKSLSGKYSYSKAKIGFVFFLLWFIPCFSFWAGLLVVRKVIY